MDCHMVAEERMDLRPKKRYMRVGEAFMRLSTMGAERPGGAMAGARAMKTLIFWLSCGWMLRAAKAWAVPWLKPM